MVRIKKRNQDVHVQKRSHQAPSSSAISCTCSREMTSPRLGRIGTPFLVRCLALCSPLNACRASFDKTRPAVDPSRPANSLAACRTSSSISNVVRTHLMLSHHLLAVKYPVVLDPSEVLTANHAN